MKITQNKLNSLVEKFERMTLPKSEWTHEAHLAVAIYYCRMFHIDSASRRMKQFILSYNLHCGVPNTDNSGYHETITLFWIHVANQFLVDNQNKPFSSIINEFIYSGKHSPKYILKFYSKDLLESIVSRKEWVVPNLCNLPDASVLKASSSS